LNNRGDPNRNRIPNANHVQTTRKDPLPSKGEVKKLGEKMIDLKSRLHRAQNKVNRVRCQKREKAARTMTKKGMAQDSQHDSGPPLHRSSLHQSSLKPEKNNWNQTSRAIHRRGDLMKIIHEIIGWSSAFVAIIALSTVFFLFIQDTHYNPDKYICLKNCASRCENKTVILGPGDKICLDGINCTNYITYNKTGIHIHTTNPFINSSGNRTA